MTTRSPPRLATWLLEGLGSGGRVEELIGDLTEQFTAGRSRLWYWRQAGGALALDLLRTLRIHGLSFIAAVLVGYALTSLWVFANNLAFAALYQSLDARPQPRTVDMLMRFLGVRAAQASDTILTFVSAWLVMRIHRAHQRAVLLTFAAAVVAQHFSSVAHVVASVINGSLPRSLLVPAIMPIGLQAVFTPLIGLWLIRRQRFVDMPARIRCVSVLTVTLALANALLFDLWRVGVLSYPPAERYPADAVEIACAAYLTYLLWRRISHSIPLKTVTGPATAGPQAS